MKQNTLLTPKDVKSVMEQDILIAADTRANKKFVFNPQQNEFTIYKDDEYVDGGQAMEDLLDVYNDLT
jgi:hypothetical protein